MEDAEEWGKVQMPRYERRTIVHENVPEIRGDEMGFTCKMEHWIIALETKGMSVRILPKKW